MINQSSKWKLRRKLVNEIIKMKEMKVKFWLKVDHKLTIIKNKL